MTARIGVRIKLIRRRVVFETILSDDEDYRDVRRVWIQRPDLFRIRQSHQAGSRRRSHRLDRLSCRLRPLDYFACNDYTTRLHYSKLENIAGVIR